MNNKILFTVIGLIFFTLSSCEQEIEKLENPNVLFIMVDDLNDYQGVYGGHPQAQTPNIDKLAATSIKFNNAHTNVPVCQPSRNSLFTGVYPHASRDFGWTPHRKQVVLKHNKTLIELFKEKGYKTLGTGKLLHKNNKKYWDAWGTPEGINYGPHASSGDGIMGHSSVPEPFRGINIVDGSFAPLTDTPFIIDENGNKVETGWAYNKKKAYRYVNDDDRDLMPDELHAKWVSEQLAKLEQEEGEQPFFMGVGFVNPHTPLYAPQKYFDKFPLDKITLPVIKEGDLDDTYYMSVYPDTEMGIAYYRKLKESYKGDNEGLKRFLQAYLACISFMDDQLGTVLTALENSKFKDNTIVVFVSDHGWQMGEKDYLYKNSPWEESTRIPYLIRMPKSNSNGKEVNQPVSLIDIFPTLVDYCDLGTNYAREEKFTKPGGYSLRTLIENPEKEEWEGPNGALTVVGVGINKEVEGLGVNKNKGALWHVEIIRDLDTSYVMQQNYSYRTKDFRYILYKNGKEELYKHPEDSFEHNNLADDDKFSVVKTQLKKEMINIIESR